MISSAIIFFLLLGMGQLICNTTLFKLRADDGLFAAELASSKLEELRGLFHMDNSLQTGEFSEIIELQGNHGSSKSFLRSWSIVETDPEILTVIVECAPVHIPRKKTLLILPLSKALGF